MTKIEQTSATQILKDTDTHTRVSLDTRYSVDEYEFMQRSFNRSMNKWASFFLEIYANPDKRPGH
jgi:hypothetical protein